MKAWKFSVADYHKLGDMGLIPEKTELLYGTIFTKIPKTPLHVFIQSRLLDLIREVLPANHLLRPEFPITTADSEPEPDISIVQGTRDDFLKEHPHSAELAVEVCVTSHEYDRSKLRAYAEAGVREVWLVLAPERHIEVYRDPAGSVFREKQILTAGTLECRSLPGVRIEIAPILPNEADLQ